MDLIRGRWTEQYINCVEDKRNFDHLMRGRNLSHHELALRYCEKYHVPDLSADEKNEIIKYWHQYGIRLMDFSYHRMYYYVTGIHDPRFVPDYIAGHVVYSYYNDHAYEYTWRDKNMFDRLLPEIPFPYTYAKRIRGRFKIGNDYYSRNDFASAAKRVFDEIQSKEQRTIIIKPARQSGFGRGKKVYNSS